MRTSGVVVRAIGGVAMRNKGVVMQERDKRMAMS